MSTVKPNGFISTIVASFSSKNLYNYFTTCSASLYNAFDNYKLSATYFATSSVNPVLFLTKNFLIKFGSPSSILTPPFGQVTIEIP